MNRSHTSTRRVARGFSLIEMLIALAISASLLAATLAALHSTFLHYKSTTESASTHVISRIVMHRILSMVRTGTEFGPIPDDVFNAAENPLESTFMEFVSQQDLEGGIARITRLEYRDSATAGAAGELWYVLLQPGSPPTILEQRPLLSGVRRVDFRLHFSERTWLLDRAEVDMTIEPNDSRDLTIGADTMPQTIRLVASAAPRHSM